jgi:hypothetical protein
MRTVTWFFVMALFLSSFASPRAFADEVHGNLHFSLDDGVTRSLQFHAKIDKAGAAEGRMTFTDPSALPESDPDDADGPKESTLGISIDVDFDCMVVKENVAVMGGVVVASNEPKAVGRRVLLTVEDNGEGKKAEPDRLAWGIYGNEPKKWIPSDAELEDDKGASLTWIATDAEREDDIGVPSHRSETIGCDSFPLAAYALLDIQQGDGNIQIKP